MNRKEEILDTKNWNSEYPNYMAENEILEAMDEYAKEVAIGFAEWISNHRLDFQPASKGNFIGIDMVTYSPSELFDQYLKTLNE